MTALSTYSPFEFFRGTPFFRSVEQAPEWEWVGPPVDIWETREGITLQLDVPGYVPSELHVELDGTTLTLFGERKAPASGEGEKALRRERAFGSFRRVFELPDYALGASPTAQVAQGVLTVQVPRREELKPRRVEVQVK